MKIYSSIIACTLFLQSAHAQLAPKTFPSFPDNNFYNYQTSFDRVKQANLKYETQWKNLFHKKGLNFPNTNIFLREFKNDGELEVWARNTPKDTFTFIKTFKVCVLSGKVGPKRKENDLQVPEGFYFIDEFNPKSNYYLSLLLSYPNYSDLMKGNKETPGGDIYIHGSCVTVGCIPITDTCIQEVYSLAMLARTNGQYNVPVHVFPTRFTRRGLDYLGRFYKENDNQAFWVNLKKGYDYFESYKKLPPILYDTKGNYVF